MTATWSTSPESLFFCTLVTGPRRSLSLKLSDTRVYGPQVRARLGTTGVGDAEADAVRGRVARPCSLLSPVDPSFRALSGRLKFTVRRHKFNKDSLSAGVGDAEADAIRGGAGGLCGRAPRMVALNHTDAPSHSFTLPITCPGQTISDVPGS